MDGTFSAKYQLKIDSRARFNKRTEGTLDGPIQLGSNVSEGHIEIEDTAAEAIALIDPVTVIDRLAGTRVDKRRGGIGRRSRVRRVVVDLTHVFGRENALIVVHREDPAVALGIEYECLPAV